MNARIEECRFQGEPGLRLVAGQVTATFLPHVGMTGVSLRCRGQEFLSLPGGVDGLRAGSTAGIPLLAPWANRLASWRYRIGSVSVDLHGSRIPTDDNGLPIHGLLLGSPNWRVDTQRSGRGRARLGASVEVDAPEFPFAHRVELRVIAGDGLLEITTTVTPTGRRPVPVSFGWHPYLRLPGVERSRWSLRLPARDHIALDPRSIPTGVTRQEPGEAAPIGARTFDDLYAVRRGRRLAIETGEDKALEVRCGTGYDFFQVWVPEGRPFVALEPMVAPTNALIEGTAPLIAPGDSYSAQFSIRLQSP